MGDLIQRTLWASHCWSHKGAGTRYGNHVLLYSPLSMLLLPMPDILRGETQCFLALAEETLGLGVWRFIIATIPADKQS